MGKNRKKKSRHNISQPRQEESGLQEVGSRNKPTPAHEDGTIMNANNGDLQQPAGVTAPSTTTTTTNYPNNGLPSNNTGHEIHLMKENVSAKDNHENSMDGKVVPLDDGDGDVDNRNDTTATDNSNNANKISKKRSKPPALTNTITGKAIARDTRGTVVPTDHDGGSNKAPKKQKTSVDASSTAVTVESRDGDPKNNNTISSDSTINAENDMSSNVKVTRQEDEEINNLDHGAIDRDFFSDQRFTNLPLSDKTLAGLAAMKMDRMTRVQDQAIPALLAGKDLIAAAKTGSGKTLAFVIPAIELLHKMQFTNKNGTGVIVIAPTRELSLQIYGVVQELMQQGHHTQTYGLVMGGANRRTEAERLIRGVNMIICTPGRLLDHLQNTKGFNVRNLLALIMDEADRILEQGFEDDLRAILRILPSQRQTMLFSATQTKRVEDLVRLSMNPEQAIFVDVGASSADGGDGPNAATVGGLEQGYVSCPSDQRFLLLFTFLKKNKKKKIMVFFSSCNSVKFHAELLNYIDVPVMDIHGRQKQVKRTTTFFQFCNCETGTLLCTDVAARGLDIPRVDWIIQYDPPDDPKEYIHRVGRTARGATGSGRALLFLTPQETGFLRYLQAATQVRLNEYEFPSHKVANVQSQLMRLMDSNYYLNRAARDAYRSYLLAYASHSHRDIFNVHALDLQAVGMAFGFSAPPRVDLLSIGHGKDKQRHRAPKKGTPAAGAAAGGNKQARYGSSGHAFSASNPYGKRASGDHRQFSH